MNEKKDTAKIFLVRMVHIIGLVSEKLSQLSLSLMFVIVFTNIVMRKLVKPLFGSYDYVSLANAVFVTFSIVYCAVNNNHVRLEFFVRYIPSRLRGPITGFFTVITLLICLLISWEFLKLGRRLSVVGETTPTASLPISPFTYVVGFGFLILALVSLFLLLANVLRTGNDHGK